MRTLQPGEVLPWPHDTLSVSIEPGAGPSIATAGSYDISLLLLGADGSVGSDEDLVFYNNPERPGARWTQDEVRVDLRALPADVLVVRTIISCEGDGLGSRDLVATASSGFEPIARFKPSLQSERAAVALEVFRSAPGMPQWSLHAVGRGWSGGLADAVRAHGIEVEGDPVAEQRSEPQPTIRRPEPFQPELPIPSMPAPARPEPTLTDEDIQRRLFGIRTDLAQSVAAYSSAVQWASQAREDALGALADQRGMGAVTPATTPFDDVMARATTRFDQESRLIQQETDRLEADLPIALARFSAPVWARRQVWSADSPPLPTLVRVGDITPPDRTTPALPAIITVVGQPIMWVDDPGTLRGSTFAAGIAARWLTGDTPDIFEIETLDMTGDLARRLERVRSRSLIIRRSPDEVRQRLASLDHQADLARMAFDSGIEDALDDVWDGTVRLLLVTEVPTGFDQTMVDALARLSRVAPLLGTQLLFTMNRSDIESPVGEALAQNALILDASGNCEIADSAGAPWTFSPGVTDDDVDNALAAIASMTAR